MRFYLFDKRLSWVLESHHRFIIRLVLVSNINYLCKLILILFVHMPLIILMTSIIRIQTILQQI